ncbi:hypothetical protein BJV82DRAFT_522852 [Fennellomyces sp. T-0311]|nr:hypothetical protein BJV82DRAFT_522852 [Fennellomyces sp. T-0311]
MRICYYELLSVDRSATDLELKKAYRKQALIWHPDKNGDRVQEATERFAMIQEAYEVLSDPHERAWYDGHRDSILRGDDAAVHKDSSAGTTSDDLMRYFSMSEFKGFNDDDKGYYAVYRKLFEKLSDEEESAHNADPPEDGQSYTRYPMFGNSKTPFADSDGYRGYGGYARDFYAAWMNFSSVKSFQWMDKWRLRDAPNRFVRRAMEKENKKARETARKEYNDTVRSLATFVRKRDPRFKAYQEEERIRKEAAAAEQKARAQREKEELQAQIAAYQEPEWAKVDPVLVDAFTSDESESDDDQGGSEETDFYCVVCDKFYKSEQQYTSHESSKKHLKLAEKMKREMMADEEAFDFGQDKKEEEVKTLKKKKKGKKTPKFGIEEEEDLDALTASLTLDPSGRRRRTNRKEEPTEAEANEPAKETAKMKRERRKEKKKQKEENVGCTI